MGVANPPRTASDAKAPKEQEPSPAPRGDRAVTAVSHIVLAIWSIIVILPLVWVFLSSWKTTGEIFKSPLALPQHWSFDNYIGAWTDSHIGRYMLNSVIVVTSALVIVMILGSAAAYSLARYPFPGSGVVYYFILAGLTFPIFLAIVPLFFVLKNVGLLNTLPGLIATYVAFAFPFTVFFLYPFFRALPQEIAEAAELDGAGEWRTFAQVMVPMARPGIVAIAIFNFLGLWNQFLLPIALNTNEDNYVLSQGMARFASQAGYAVDFGQLFAAVVITIVPVLAVYIFSQRQLQGSLSQGTLK
ncbi:sugar ABC transporter permease [Intrasporangium oryzae NRRL B-24470]|uniref:Sugar ABC transporter permease n=1 Tax=Intrasporangium oryzae NRRL B-24470 TaxID=1386089 RepID=W9G9F6_9MICO|nr:carbohydrate ABC transporter permease [Intrasporangium oryzae]EWT02680.1 sugar ABC transporter permease [Intrasporangium oryzae NRRL B-24470]